VSVRSAPAAASPKAIEQLRDLRIAIVHDWLVTYAGAERVLEQLLILFPHADVFTIVDLLRDDERAFLNGAAVHTSFIQQLPLLRRRHRALLPLMPLAVEQFDMSDYDLVISSSHAVAKGVITGPEQLHIAYCHSPMRYAWDLQHQYLRESGAHGLKSWLARWFLHRMRMWDVRTGNGVDAFVANSRFIARRIRKVYGRPSRVIYPPVDVDGFTPGETRDDFFLAASRMVPYKRMSLIVEAFTAMPDRRLLVIGDGPELARIRAVAGPNVELAGWQPTPVVRDAMQRARAFVFAAEEDFGIMPVEAQACGTPVIAYGRGGVLETVEDGATGIFFHEQSVPALVDAVRRFDRDGDHLSARYIRARAERFSASRFREDFGRFTVCRWERVLSERGRTRLTWSGSARRPSWSLSP
jgi:glycosyltransferase involved in cell wall biosynthesis